MKHVYRVLVPSHRPDPFVVWPALIGDIVHNLRSALNHLAWQLVLSEGNSPGSWTEFPVFADENVFGEKAGRKVRGIPADIVTYLEAIQPFHSPEGKERDGHPLWLIHELNRVDKHQVINVVASSLSANAFEVLPHMKSRRSVPGRLVDNKVVAEILTHEPVNSDHDFDFQVEVEIVFDQAPFADLPVLGTLELCFTTVYPLIVQPLGAHVLALLAAGREPPL